MQLVGLNKYGYRNNLYTLHVLVRTSNAINHILKKCNYSYPTPIIITRTHPNITFITTLRLLLLNMIWNYAIGERPKGLVFNIVHLVKRNWRMREFVGRGQYLFPYCEITKRGRCENFVKVCVCMWWKWNLAHILGVGNFVWWWIINMPARSLNGEGWYHMTNKGWCESVRLYLSEFMCMWTLIHWSKIEV